MTRRRVSPFAWLLPVAVVFVLLAPSTAMAKDYFISKLAITGTVGADGGLEVVDRREVDFSGSFTWAQWALNKKGGTGIRVISVEGPTGPMTLIPDTVETPGRNQYIVRDETERVVLKVGFSAEDETIPFTIRYRVTGAAKRYTDTAELYWQFVGNETTVRSEDVTVHIVLPKVGGKEIPAADVRAWAHGPLTGVVTPVDGGADLRVATLPPNTFVEGRLLFPPAALSDANTIGQQRAPAVLAEEGKLADEANAQRRAAQEEVRRQEEQAAAAARLRAILTPFVAGAGILVPLALLVVSAVMWTRYGRDYKPQFTGYLRDVPEGIGVPLVGSLWADGQPGDPTVGACLMDLALQGAVVMRPVSKHEDGFLGIGAHDEATFELTLDRTKLAQADPLERDLAAFFFDETMQRDAFTIHDLRDQAKAAPRAFTSGLSEWRMKTYRAAEERGWFEKAGRWAQVLCGFFVILGTGVGIVATVYTGMIWLVLLWLPMMVGVTVLTVLMRRRSPEATELYARYEGLRDYLRDFSRLNEAPPMHVILWERFLVMAVVFGIAEQVIADMRVRVPDVVNDPTFATAYWWAYGGGDYASPVSAVTAGVSDAVSVANSAMSSSSGGGGGFSGGGGGGGGGGGFSAG